MLRLTPESLVKNTAVPGHPWSSSQSDSARSTAIHRSRSRSSRASVKWNYHFPQTRQVLVIRPMPLATSSQVQQTARGNHVPATTMVGGAEKDSGNQGLTLIHPVPATRRTQGASSAMSTRHLTNEPGKHIIDAGTVTIAALVSRHPPHQDINVHTLNPAQKEIITSFMDANDVPGVAVAVNHNGKVVAGGGVGQACIATGRKPGAETLWPIASVTKSFTGVLAMQLVEDGLLDLDAPVLDYLPALLVADRETTSRLTMRRLLTHTAGLGRTGHQDRTREEPVNPFPTRESLVAALHDVVPQAPVGGRFSYSNESLAIAGRVIETLRALPLETCLERYIFEPVGMSRTVARFSEWRADADRAVLYAGSGIGPYGSGERHGDYEVVELVEDYQTFLSTGGIASTVSDLAKYQLATMDRESSALGLSGAALTHMQSTQHLYGDSGYGYGLGYWVLPLGEASVIGHSGGLPGVSTYSMMIPSEKCGVVVLTNRSDVKAMVLAEQLLNDLRGQMWRAKPTEPLPIHSKWATVSTDDLAPYVGNYRFRRGPALVQANADGLVITTPSRYDGPPQDLATVRVAKDRFLCVADGHVVEFLRDDAGAVCAFTNSGYVYQREAWLG
jgi:CubicO group peptidase (beta-lactamase class C family)